MPDIRLILEQAVAFHQRGKLDQAEALYEKALAAAPDNFDVLNLLGTLHCQRSNFDAGVRYLTQAVEINARNPATLSNLAYALRELGRPGEAIENCDRALALAPDFADALTNRGAALGDLRRHGDALSDSERAIKLAPDSAVAHCNRGNALLGLGRPRDALASYDRAVAIRPEYMEAVHNRGTAFRELRRPHEAMTSYRQALAISPNYAQAISNLANTLAELGQFDEAAREFERLIALDPYYDCALGGLLDTRMQQCDWRDYDKQVGLVRAGVMTGENVINPFTYLAIPSSPLEQRKCAETFSKAKLIPAVPWTADRKQYRHDRIRLAYLSADFRDHAVSYLVAGLIEAHDPKKFKTIAISYGPKTKDKTRQRLEGEFDLFLDCEHMSDQEILALMQKHEIDIAVDLMGFTRHSRPNLLAARLAPVQVGYLGYPGTIGSPSLDYILADRTVIPEEDRGHYTEQVVYLPDAYQVNDAKRKIADWTPTRQQMALPETGFVFCSFNNHYKISPAVFDVWMRLLREVAGSVLWLIAGSPTSTRNLRQRAEERGIGRDRLVFAARTNLEDHLARHRLADLFLDTLPYNAHTTASDALWAGLPVVTCQGNTFAGRVAASLLHATGLPELITDTLEGYFTLALDLARNPSALAAIKTRLAQDREAQPLFDTARQCRYIESAYVKMWERQQRGVPPSHLVVERT